MTPQEYLDSLNRSFYGPWDLLCALDGYYPTNPEDRVAKLDLVTSVKVDYARSVSLCFSYGAGPLKLK